jgi:hypothetical protein
VSQQQLFSTPQTEMTSDDYYTPPEVFERLGVVFDVDVCAPPGGVPWIPAKTYLTQADDALVADWVGNVWLNPPFSNPTPFVKKFVQHKQGIALIPTSNGRWLQDLWQTDVSWVLIDCLRFYNGATQTQMKHIIFTRCWLVAFGSDNIKAIGRFGKVR